MQGFISHSVYWVAFGGAIHGSLFIKNRLPIAHTREGRAYIPYNIYIERKETSKNTTVRST